MSEQTKTIELLGWLSFVALAYFVLGILFGSMNEREFLIKHPQVICEKRTP